MSLKLKYYLKTHTQLDEVQIVHLMECFQPEAIKANEILHAAGETCQKFYFIHSGCVRTYYIKPEGNEKTRFIAFENTIITAFASFIAQKPSLEFVDALEDSELYSIRHADFFHWVEGYPQWANYYQTLLETAYLFQNRKIEELVTLSARQRYEKLLTENPIFVQRLSNRILASFLDIRQETLSRIKSQ